MLRAWAAFLAGANHMRRRTFFLWNAAGGILWATIYGLLGYILGDNLPLLGRILKALGIFGFVAVGVVIAAAIAFWLFRRRRRRAKLRQVVARDRDDAATSAETPGATPKPGSSRHARHQ